MSFMAVFDQNGRCKYTLDGSPESADLSSEAAVVYLDSPVNPNEVWYDHAAGAMRPRTHFRLLVSQNKIEGIPAGTVVYVGSESAVINEGYIEFEVSYPQKVVATLMHVRHMEKVVEVQCEATG